MYLILYNYQETSRDMYIVAIHEVNVVPAPNKQSLWTSTARETRSAAPSKSIAIKLCVLLCVFEAYRGYLLFTYNVASIIRTSRGPNKMESSNYGS